MFGHGGAAGLLNVAADARSRHRIKASARSTGAGRALKLSQIVDPPMHVRHDPWLQGAGARNAVSADVIIGETRLKPHRLRRRDPRRGSCASVHGACRRRRVSCISPSTRWAIRRRLTGRARRPLHVRRGVQCRPGPRQASACLLRRHDFALGAAFGIHHLYVELPFDPVGAPFQPPASSLAAPMASSCRQAGPLLVAIDLQLMNDEPGRIAVDAALSTGRVWRSRKTPTGTALYATRLSARFWRLRAYPRARSGSWAERAGALVQRADRAGNLSHARPSRPAEGCRSWRHRSAGSRRRLAELTEELRGTSALADNSRLLDELTALAAVNSGRAPPRSLFPLRRQPPADEIVQTRLRIIGERKVGGLPTWSSFLARRMAPAIRTCATTEERQANLSRKPARAAHLPAHARRCRTGAAEPGIAEINERAHAHAASAAGDGRRIAGRSDQLLRVSGCLAI